MDEHKQAHSTANGEHEYEAPVVEDLETSNGPSTVAPTVITQIPGK